MFKIHDIVLKNNLCWFNTTLPIQTIALMNNFYLWSPYLLRGFEMGDHLQIKGDPIEDFDVGHHKSAHNLHWTYFLSLRVLTTT